MHHTFLLYMLAYHPPRNHQKKIHEVLFLPVSTFCFFLSFVLLLSGCVVWWLVSNCFKEGIKRRMLSSRKIEGEKLTFFCIQCEQDTVLGTHILLVCIIDIRFHFPSFVTPAFNFFSQYHVLNRLVKIQLLSQDLDIFKLIDLYYFLMSQFFLLFSFLFLPPSSGNHHLEFYNNLLISLVFYSFFFFYFFLFCSFLPFPAFSSRILSRSNDGGHPYLAPDFIGSIGTFHH